MIIDLEKREVLLLSFLKNCDSKVSKTKLQKLVFLAQDEGNIGEFYNFKKYDYGPYSKEIIKDIEKLEDKDIVSISKSKTFGGNIREKYSIKNRGDRILRNLEEDGKCETIINISDTTYEKYGKLSLREIINSIYDKHPEYAESIYLY